VRARIYHAGIVEVTLVPIKQTADTVVISTLGDGYSLIASNAIQTQFTFSNTNSTLNTAIEIGTFLSGASTSTLAVASTPSDNEKVNRKSAFHLLFILQKS
jgi:hypothetical protein